eukprot:1774922-Prymnesium_polylepis.2
MPPVGCHGHLMCCGVVSGVVRHALCYVRTCGIIVSLAPWEPRRQPLARARLNNAMRVLRVLASAVELVHMHHMASAAAGRDRPDADRAAASKQLFT